MATREGRDMLLESVMSVVFVIREAGREADNTRRLEIQ